MNTHKRLLIMPAGLVQVHIIRTAVELGYYVITCDNNPNNPGHKYAHEHYNISTTDKHGIFKLASTLNIDGIVNYASDVSAPTAAYVAEKLNLPTSPYKSVEILTKKDLFREFLVQNGFNAPKSKSYKCIQDVLDDKKFFSLPVMIKPVDSAGTKGVNKLYDWSQLDEFIKEALDFSIDKRFIIEEFIEKKGYQISGDAFSVDGKLIFYSFGCEYYSNTMKKDFCPLGEFWPFAMDEKYITMLASELQRLMQLLDMKTTEYNVEAIIDKDDNLYLLEVAARAGGSLIPQMIKYSTGIDTLPWIIKSAAGDPFEYKSVKNIKKSNKCFANHMLHSNKSGKYVGISFDKEFEKNNLLYYECNVKKGDYLNEFRDAQDGIGEMIMKFDSMEQMNDMLPEIDKYVYVEVE